MTENICLPKSYFIIIVLMFILLTYFHSFNMNNILKKEKPDKIVIYKEPSKKQTQEPILKKESQEPVSKKEILNKRDEDAVENTFSPPERRLPYHNYPHVPLKRKINIPTRGYPDSYHNVGLLVRKNDEKIFNLFGRQKYPGSNQWEYYAAGVDTYGHETKIPLEINGDKELYNQDTLSVPILDNSKGKFEVKLFEYDVPRYNPHVF